jgi:hypothetical protein
VEAVRMGDWIQPFEDMLNCAQETAVRISDKNAEMKGFDVLGF